MRVCVTGGTGFIGRALVRRLLAEGHEVRVLARPSPRADELASRGVSLIRGDLADTRALDGAIKGAEIIFHAAAKVSGPGSRENFFQANASGTQRVLDACLRHGVRRVVYLSSIAVYGSVREGGIIDETTPLNEEPEGRDFYSQSKIAADRLVQSFAAHNNPSIVIVRPGIVYGPGKPLPNALLGFRIGRTNCIFGTPEQRFPLNYIENLVDALALSMKSNQESARDYIVVDDENLTLGQYHRTKSDADHTRTIFLPGWPVLVGGPLGGISRQQVLRALQNRHYSTRRIREELGWSPRVDLKDAIELTIASAK